MAIQKGPAMFIKLIVMLSAIVVLATASEASLVNRLPLSNNSTIVSQGIARSVIIVPNEKAYIALGQKLSDNIAKLTGVQIPVEAASDYVSEKPRLIKVDKLDRNFILIGQVWNNAVLERLYANYYDPTDAVFPGPGGWEIRTICNPFKRGQNCIAATGSDLEGCKLAVQHFANAIKKDGSDWSVPYTVDVHLTGEAREQEEAY